jgi:protein-disulfide isomerase
MRTILKYAKFVIPPLALLAPLGAGEQDITREQADAIVNELRQIRTLLEKQGRTPLPEQPSRAKLDLADAPLLGSKDAPLTLVEFTDYQCPFCQKFQSSAFPELKRNYIDSGRLRFYSRDLPLEMHNDAQRAAQAARCAGDQGRFWELRDAMAIHPGDLAEEKLIAYAAEAGMETGAFRACLSSQKYQHAVQKDMEEADRIGVRGTPSFVLGRSTKDGVEGEVFVGALPYATFEQKLEQLMNTR